MLDSALRDGQRARCSPPTWRQLDGHEIAALRLGKKTEAAIERSGEAARSSSTATRTAVDVRFNESDVDQARAAGVLIEFERSAPIIVDRSLYRELVKAAITRTVAELRAKVAALASTSARRPPKQKTSAPADPGSEAEREHRRQMRELAEQAHGVNLDLGAELLNGLSTVDPADITVARSSCTRCWAPTTTTRPTPRPASGSRALADAASGW